MQIITIAKYLIQVSSQRTQEPLLWQEGFTWIILHIEVVITNAAIKAWKRRDVEVANTTGAYMNA